MTKRATDWLILSSLFLKLEHRMKELLVNKNQLAIDVRMMDGQNKLQPQETEQ